MEKTDLIDGAIARLGAQLPASWRVARHEPGVMRNAAGNGPDAAIEIRAPDGGSATYAVQARRSFLPRDVERLGPAPTHGERSSAGISPTLVVTPWLSRRAQELLEREQVNFLDLTGNALIHLENPAVYVRTVGAQHNPDPPPRSLASVRGPKAGRLIRLLADVRPPYGVRELAAAAKLAPGYVSRLLDALDREAIVERTSRGEVDRVDVPALINRWVEAYDVFKSNGPRRFIARAGVRRALDKLQTSEVGSRVVISGSFAAVRLAPVAGPALLLAYTDDIDGVAKALDLLPGDSANVILVRPFDGAVWERTTTEDGISYAASSQVAADCLTGPGRMPAEGEALLNWMVSNEPKWRLSSLREMVGRSPNDRRDQPSE